MNSLHAPKSRAGSFILMIAATAVFSLVGACRSDDLGRSRAPRVAIDTTAGWDAGVGSLIGAKCAGCHTPLRGPMVPANTPDSIDAVATPGFFEAADNLGLIKLIRHRVVDGGTETMPPKFATPLYPEERRALTQFLDDAVAGLAALPVAGGALTPGQRCEPASAAAAATLEATLARSCALSGCHGGAHPRAGLPPLGTAADWTAVSARAKDFVTRGVMPPGDPTFAASSSGLTLLGDGCAPAAATPAPMPPKATPPLPATPPPSVVDALPAASGRANGRVTLTAQLRDDADAPLATPTTYADVAPILASRCQGCHADTTVLRLTTLPFASWDSAATQPQIVDMMIGRLTAANDDERMPPAPRPRLAAADIDVIKAWRAAGLRSTPPPDALSQVDTLQCTLTLTSDGSSRLIDLQRQSAHRYAASVPDLVLNAAYALVCPATGTLPGARVDTLTTPFLATPDFALALDLVVRPQGVSP